MNGSLLASGGATLSTCETYRYHLWRNLGDPERRACFIMLNPSTADGVRDDPTIRRCVRFAKRFGCGWLDVVNLFPLRTTSPSALWAHDDRGEVSTRNPMMVRDIAAGAQFTIAAWGSQRHKSFVRRRRAALFWLEGSFVDLHCLGTTKDGNPRHPLYVRSDAELEPWRAP